MTEEVLRNRIKYRLFLTEAYIKTEFPDHTIKRLRDMVRDIEEYMIGKQNNTLRKTFNKENTVEEWIEHLIKEHKNTYSTLADLCSEAYKKGKKDGYEEALNEVRMLSNDEELNQIILNKLMES